MDEALIKIGLPVSCAYGDCEVTGFVNPQSDYGGWYKSKMFRFKPHKRWFCPEHYEEGRLIDNKFYKNYLTPDPYTDTELSTLEELNKLLD